MIKINYTLSAHRDVLPHVIHQRLDQVRRQIGDMPVKSVSDIHSQLFPQTEVHVFGGKPFVPALRTGFHCEFWGHTSDLTIQLNQFPEEGECPRYWVYEGTFWTLSTLKTDEFVGRHRTVIKILDALKNADIGIQVVDESGYYLDRNLGQLQEFKQAMDHAGDPRESMVR